MRILHFIPTLVGGGAERQLAYLTRELARRGHDVQVAYLYEGAAVWPNPEIPTIRLPSAHPWDPRTLAAGVRHARSWRPDVIHTWILKADVIGGLAAWMTGTPWVLREPTIGGFYDWSGRAQIRLAVARGARASIVANSALGVEYWKTRAPHLDRRVIPNGVDIDALDRVEPQPASRRTIGIVASRLEPSKRVETVLAAAAEVMRTADLELIVCGDGVDRARLEARARELGIASRVTFPGHTRDLWSHIKGAAFFVSLSEFEGCPNIVLEAFALRVPAILSDIPAHRALADETSAFLVERPDAHNTARAMRALLADRPEARRRAEAARARIESYSLSAMTTAFEMVYADARTAAR